MTRSAAKVAGLMEPAVQMSHFGMSSKGRRLGVKISLIGVFT